MCISSLFILFFVCDMQSEILNCEVPHLTKTLIFENTKYDVASPKLPFRYIAVVTQYQAKLNSEELGKVVRKQLGGSRNSHNYQLASEDDTVKLTGFVYNSVVPIGMTHAKIVAWTDLGLTQEPLETKQEEDKGERTMEPIPLMITKSIVDHVSFIYLGGGHVHCKCKLTLREILGNPKLFGCPLVADISS